MRPTRLEIEGFASFREPTVVDFDDADLFALTGPTGAGKSSIIDAITFALYGAVPRYDDRRLVAPVITQGKVQARVRLDFCVDDHDFVAVRVVRRTPQGGATTKEARLQRGDATVVAGNADSLTGEVERLLGLSFDHFTRCVVLPQGAFATFLHATPKERQDLLVRLLDLDVYRRVAQEANRRGQAADVRADLLRRRLEGDLAGATREAQEATDLRVTELSLLLERITDEGDHLEQLRQQLADARREEARSLEHVSLLEQVRPPDGVDALARRIQSTTRALEQAEDAADQAGQAREVAQDRREALPAEAPLRTALAAHERRAALAARHAAGVLALRQAQAAEEDARSAAETATVALGVAQRRLEHARHDHQAVALARDLRTGEPCPVCLQHVTALPAHPAPADLLAAEGELAAAKADDERARAALRGAEARRTKIQAALEGVASDLTAAETEVRDQPGPAELESTLSAIADAEDQLRQRVLAEKEARDALARAKRATAELQGAQARAWRQLDDTRDALSPLSPPGIDRGDLALAWQALRTWAQQRAQVEREAAEASRERARAAADDHAAHLDKLRAWCAQQEVDAEDRHPREACLRAVERASADREHLARRVEEASEVRGELEQAAAEARLARTLGTRLDARHFERWLLTRALAHLSRDASRILRELSAGAYSLTLDPAGAFQVVDHGNADELRPARTLSGGETFLASLALALALAEQVGELATHGSARLEALFLDEGFGTLDAETLDVVAAAIEELGARGRMVGVVTHVRELAERLPVRFEVRKVAGTSTVRKVLA